MYRVINIFAPSSKKILIVQLVFLVLLFYGFYILSFIELVYAFFFTFVYAIVGVALTFHRVLSHNHYQFHPVLKNILILIASFANVGSPLTWIAVHRAHHKYCDTNLDPHSPKHLGAIYVLFFSMFSKVNIKFARDLLRDRYCVFIHKNYYLVHAILISIILLLGGFNLLLIGYIIPGSMTWLLGSFLNYLNHTHGYSNFNTNETSTNNIITAILLCGEGWHNNHHAFPNKPNTKVKSYEFDLIHLIATKILFGSTRVYK